MTWVMIALTLFVADWWWQGWWLYWHYLWLTGGGRDGDCVDIICGWLVMMGWWWLCWYRCGCVMTTGGDDCDVKSSSGAIITDKGQQMERSVEHCSDLYSRENIVSPAALNVIECLPTMDELDLVPSVEELSKAIDSLASGKATGNAGIPPELIKHCNTTLLLPLHEVLCQCWQEGAVPQDMRDSKIITLYQNKGERNDCNNYRGISLLGIVSKVFARFILIRLQKLAERIYPESQCGFLAERSTIYMVFSLR